MAKFNNDRIFKSWNKDVLLKIIRLKMPKQKTTKTEEEWKKSLTYEQFNILRKKETEPPFTGRLVNNIENPDN